MLQQELQCNKLVKRNSCVVAIYQLSLHHFEKDILFVLSKNFVSNDLKFSDINYFEGGVSPILYTAWILSLDVSLITLNHFLQP